MNRPVAWQGVSVTDSEHPGPASWLPLPDVADRLHLPITRVHQLIRDGKLLALRRDGIVQVPADFVGDGAILKHLPGVLTLLADAGYSPEEAIGWLYAPDDSLPGTAVQALLEN